ncbi:sugar ABC transporter ATP-binding protein [Gymnodinialimonas sp. 57CJ19]|uniref:sugar ABC transporter ATP-binding protein n=1 Tax=Gymnodinialimonas sp. 57CJ19 TaxID=3138498 RepID=UPI0031343F7C
MQPILELRNITKRFASIVAMDSVSIQFRPGEVHAVIGENGAGKSTMMNIIAGDLQPNGGEVFIDGAPIVLASPLVSRAKGVSVVFQELSLCENLTVGENVLLSEFGARNALSPLSPHRSAKAARAALDRIGLGEIETSTPVASLTVAQKQLVEIARAISQNARVLILDEPNSALSPRESERLFDIVKALRAEGVAIIYVSHHLQEVLDLADTISVMRDGQMITTVPAGPDISVEALVTHMVGRTLDAHDQYALRPDANTHLGKVVLDVTQLSVPGEIADATFSLRAGEILGVAGLPDSGKDILAEAIFGLCPRGGDVMVGGIRLLPQRPFHTIAAGVSLVPADRRGAGALLEMSVAENTVSSSLKRFMSMGFLKNRAIRSEAQKSVENLDARISGLGQKIGTLSGGNQQKIILARGLLNGPRILILHEPTRGIDVGAKAEIYRILKELAAEGLAILMISSELPEVVLHSGRVIVMADGIVAGHLSGPQINEEAIMELAVGGAHDHGTATRNQEAVA